MRRAAIDDAKARSIAQWTADPCGANGALGEPGSRSYFESLVEARRVYAPWMREELAYDSFRKCDVLDVGCGQGIDVYEYARAGARATGIDLTPRHVELARLHLAAMSEQADIVEGDTERLPFPDCTFDHVSSNGVLHHTPDLGIALREIHRVLRPGGDICAVVYNRNSLHYVLSQVLHEGIVKGGLIRERSMAGVLSRTVEVSSIDARPLVNVYSPRQFRRALRAAGFDDVRTTVRHFHPDDTPVTAKLRRRMTALEDPAVLDRLGRLAGWYVVAHGIRGGPSAAGTRQT